MPPLKEVWRQFRFMPELDFAHCFVVLQRLPNLWRRRPKDGSLEFSRKAKDRSLRPVHVQAHAEFAFG